MSFYDLIISPFVEFGFTRYVLISIVFLALSVALVDVFLVMRRMSLVGDASSYAMLPGTTVSYMAVGLSLPVISIGGLATGALMVPLMRLVSRFTSLKEGANFAAFYLGSLTTGMVLASKSGDGVDLLHLLFGSVLAVDVSALQLVAAVASLTVITPAVVYCPPMLESIDPLFLRVVNGRGGIWHMLFLVLVVMNLVTGFQAFGTLMSAGLMVLPAITARLRTGNTGGLILASLAFALVCGLDGPLLSYHIEILFDPVTILWCGVLYLFSMVFGKESRILTKWLRHGKHHTVR